MHEDGYELLIGDCYERRMGLAGTGGCNGYWKRVFLGGGFLDCLFMETVLMSWGTPRDATLILFMFYAISLRLLAKLPALSFFPTVMVSCSHAFISHRFNSIFVPSLYMHVVFKQGCTLVRSPLKFCSSRWRRWLGWGMAGDNGRACRSGLTCFQRVSKYSGRHWVRSEDVFYDLGVRDDVYIRVHVVAENSPVP